MSKALVINGANFSANKVTTISFGEDVPCRGITLDNSTLSVSYNSTGSITATPSPANTTDQVEWSTSNSNVATVSSGTVSGVGLGTATITATCGSYSASCIVTVSAPAMSGTEIVGARLAGQAADTGNGLGYISSASKWGAIASSTGELPLYISASSLQDTYYPFMIPNGTSKIKLTQTGSDFNAVRFGLFNHETNNGTGFTDVVKMIHYLQDDYSGSVYEFTVQNYEGFPNTDSFVVSVGKDSSFGSSDFNNLTIEFVAAE